MRSLLCYKNNMRQKALRDLALKVTDGLLSSATDTVLFMCFLYVCSFGKTKTSVGGYQMFSEAEKLFKEFNSETIKHALSQLKHKKFISYSRNYSIEAVQITKEGMARLRENFPIYKKRRTWDGRIYLITYDIPEAQKQDRTRLRSYIKVLGGAMLQESVWIIPYNPREILHAFVDERNLSGVVIISDMGKNAVIGDLDIKTLIRQIYRLENINEQYRDYIEAYRNTKNPKHFLATKYLSILRRDPQLPFALLPDDWLGEEAHDLAAKLYPSLHL